MFGSTSPEEEQVEAPQAKAETNSKQIVGWVLEVTWPRSNGNVSTQKPGLGRDVAHSQVQLFCQT